MVQAAPARGVDLRLLATFIAPIRMREDTRGCSLDSSICRRTTRRHNAFMDSHSLVDPSVIDHLLFSNLPPVVSTLDLAMISALPLVLLPSRCVVLLPLTK